MSEERGYWDGAMAGRLQRRRLLGAGITGAAGLALAAAGCGGGKQTASKPAGDQQAQAGTPQNGGTLTSWLVTGNLPSLDPHQTPSAWTMDSAGAVMSRILRFKTG